MKRMHHLVLRQLVGVTLFALSGALGYGATPSAGDTFTNPLLPQGPDPWVTLHQGVYYYMHTMSDRLVLWKTRDLTELKHAERKTIWTPTDPKGSKHLWAPEIHRIDNKWYAYYAADDGHSDNHQMYVVENPAEDPFDGTFVSKGRIRTDPEDNWAIDGTVFQLHGALYMAWSGWQTRRVDTETQCLYIARMANPWTLAGSRVRISKPELEWERRWQNENGRHPDHAVYVNEGPAAIESPKGDKIFLFYSASGCWTPYYAIGMLTADASGNLLDPITWKKSAQPVFQQAPRNGVYGPGHNSFFPSPDGKETWILYHARDTQTDPNRRDVRSPRAQKMGWSEDGTPVLDVPQPTATPLAKPSGTPRQ